MADRKKQLQRKFLGRIKTKSSIPIQSFLKFTQPFFIPQIVKQKRLFITNDSQFKEMKFQKFLACLTMMEIDKISIMNSKHGYYYVPQIVKNIQIVNLKVLFLINIDLTSIEIIQRLDLSKTTQISLHSNYVCNLQCLRKIHATQISLLNFSKNVVSDNNWCRQLSSSKIKGIFFDSYKLDQKNLAVQWVFALMASNILNVPISLDPKRQALSNPSFFQKRYPNSTAYADKKAYNQFYKKISSTK